MRNHYIFGYGSLICADSRSRTASSGFSLPVRVKGVARKWRAMGGSAQAMSSVAIEEQPDSGCNGVLFAVNEHELAEFDARELPHGYRRIALARACVEAIGGVLPEGHYFAYVSAGQPEPCAAIPIVQSYVDVIMQGALAIDTAFARELIETTQGWCGPWVNDRAAPVYPRALAAGHDYRDIDQILARYINRPTK